MVNTRIRADVAVRPFQAAVECQCSHQFASGSRRYLSTGAFEVNALAWWKADNPAKEEMAWVLDFDLGSYQSEEQILSFPVFFPRAQSTRRLKKRTKNDRQGSDRQGGGGNYRNNNNNYYSRDKNRNSGAGRDQRNRGQQSHQSTNSGSQQSRVPSEGYTHPVCNTCDEDTQSVTSAAALAFKCGQLVIFSGTARRTLVLVRLVMRQKYDWQILKY
ncbi:hypothetical protein Tco_0843298 [Tanacetum coccineum]|uniref:Uncharacterized protein n=1 Tax=Tanacetum coccineum TaxID=301880 RepID=A0ABQ5B5U0_9ASTR